MLSWCVLYAETVSCTDLWISLLHVLGRITWIPKHTPTQTQISHSPQINPSHHHPHTHHPRTPPSACSVNLFFGLPPMQPIRSPLCSPWDVLRDRGDQRRSVTIHSSPCSEFSRTGRWVSARTVIRWAGLAKVRLTYSCLQCHRRFGCLHLDSHRNKMW